MIAFLASLGLSESLARKVAPWVVDAALLLCAAAAWAIWDHFHVKAAVQHDRDAANTTALQGQLKAETNAAGERARNTVTHHEQTEDYHAAIATAEAGDSNDPDVRLACQQLRRAGKDTTAIPQCGGR